MGNRHSKLPDHTIFGYRQINDRPNEPLFGSMGTETRSDDVTMLSQSGATPFEYEPIPYTPRSDISDDEDEDLDNLSVLEADHFISSIIPDEPEPPQPSLRKPSGSPRTRSLSDSAAKVLDTNSNSVLMQLPNPNIKKRFNQGKSPEAIQESNREHFPGRGRLRSSKSFRLENTQDVIKKSSFFNPYMQISKEFAGVRMTSEQEAEWERNIQSIVFKEQPPEELSSKLYNMVLVKRGSATNSGLGLGRSKVHVTGSTPVKQSERPATGTPLFFRDLNSYAHVRGCSYNLISVSPNISKLASRMYSLQLCCNKLTRLPDEIGQLTKLRLLSLSNNQLTELPESIGLLINLYDLRLSQNKLKTLPKSTLALRRLKHLYLDRNQFKSLPPSVLYMKKLRNISIAHNPISFLPYEFLYLRKIHILDMTDCPILDKVPPIGQSRFSRISHDFGYITMANFQQGPDEDHNWPCAFKDKGLRSRPFNPLEDEDHPAWPLSPKCIANFDTLPDAWKKEITKSWNIHEDPYFFTVPSLKEFSCRNVVKLMTPILLSTPPSLLTYLSRAKSCSYCNGVYFDSWTPRINYYSKGGVHLPFLRRLCWAHWHTEYQKLTEFVHDRPVQSPPHDYSDRIAKAERQYLDLLDRVSYAYHDYIKRKEDPVEGNTSGYLSVGTSGDELMVSSSDMITKPKKKEKPYKRYYYRPHLTTAEWAFNPYHFVTEIENQADIEPPISRSLPEGKEFPKPVYRNNTSISDEYVSLLTISELPKFSFANQSK